MSRWIIIAGIAAVLVSLVALVTIPGGSSQPDVADQTTHQRDVPETPDTPNPSTTPSTTPAAPNTPNSSTTPATTPETAPDTTTPEQAEGGQANQGGGLLQGARPSDRQEAPGLRPRVATIETTGDASYSCSVGHIDSPRTVRGTSPAPYQVRVTPGGSSLDTVMAVCQKISGEELGVRIIYDGEVKAQEDTTARLGTVSVSWSPMQQ